MPIKKMPIDKAKIVSAKIKEDVVASMATGVWVTPKVPEKVGSSFKPTQKTQSGEFSGEPETDRHLPKFNAAKLNNRFKNPIYIGVRNPYALVNAIIQYRNKINPSITTDLIDWDSLSAENCKDVLGTYLGISSTGSTISYDQMFDPAYHSVLFSVITPRTTRGEIASGAVVTGAIPPGRTCTNATTWVASTLPWTVGDYPVFDAPRQGAADDCWFIAALISIAWVLPDMLTADNSCGIYILDPAGSVDDGYLYPSDDLPLPTGSTPTSSNFWWSSSKNAERWVAMMEKALGIRILNTGDHPNICTLPRGDPQYALYVLMGDVNWQRFWNNTPTGGATRWKNETGTTTYTTNTLWTLLLNNCSSPTGKAFRKTNNPTVAFTYVSAASAPKLPDGSLLKYNSDLLVASHSYSLLGVYQENGINYVVLRNPWGITSGVTYGQRNPIPGCGGSLATGPLPDFKQNGVNQALWDGYVTTGKLMNGIFALDIATFSRYFWGFSWT